MICKHYILDGRVQGVGFRPFVHNLATQLNLAGWVQNTSGNVSVRVEGDAHVVADFERRLISDAPPQAKPSIRERWDKTVRQLKSFLIITSDSQAKTGNHNVQVPPDHYCCPDCQSELLDSANSRYDYAFINCTQCGPRYTIIDSLPYDRRNTAMADFPLCDNCAAEYQSPSNRRFHAEPLACPQCGPTLTYTSTREGIQHDAINSACEAIQKGLVIAVKGIGGFHLMCDATQTQPIEWLRNHKPRPHKPLAIMLLPEQLDEYTHATDTHRQQLTSDVRPIVLCPKKSGVALAENIAPQLQEIGIIFPYSPLHFLLMATLRRPLVVTSANISGEPVLTEATDIHNRLQHLVDGVLNHNRPIRRPADDTVMHVVVNKPHVIRVGRGIAPLELGSPYPLDKNNTLVATGAQSKNTLCLAFDQRIIVSPHIADMDSLRSHTVFEQLIQELPALYNRNTTHIAHDAHPGYATTRWSTQQSQPRFAIYHHHAHASSLYAQTSGRNLTCDQNIMVFTWDGVGLGNDSHLWGGDCLHGHPGNWQRTLYFKPFKLPGGDRAAREPWRIADSLRLHCGIKFTSDDPLLHKMWDQNVNAPLTSAVGRLLDGCAALLGICSHASYEGQAPMELAAIAEQSNTDKHIDLPIIDGQVIWFGLIKWLIRKPHETAFAARVIHNTLAHSLIRQAVATANKTGIKTVGISGGVFQNRLLVERLTTLLPQHGLTLHHPQQIPVNDGGISIGQIIEASALMHKQSSRPL